MSGNFSSATRRDVLAASAAAGAASIFPSQVSAAVDRDAIRPFRFNASDEALADLRRRVMAT
jgi:hypothetical protein